MITPENIIVIVSDYFNQPIDRVLSTCRKEEFVKVRQLSMYFMKLYIKGITLESIGRWFPGKSDYKNHANILYGIKQVKGYIETDKFYKKDVGILDRKVTELYSLDSVIEHIETESEKFERLWGEREWILISENKHLKGEIVVLKNEVSKLQGNIYAMKLNKRKLNKREYLKSKLTPDDMRLKNPSSLGHEYSGYREHQI